MRFQILSRAKATGILNGDRKPASVMRKLNRIRTSVKELQSKVEQDLRSSDPDQFMTALVVGLMMETNEDPVLGWQKKHVQMDDNKVAYFKTRGRKKSITNSAIVQALSDAYEAVEDGDEALFSHDTGQVTAEMVGEYLSQFKLSMQDIRGFNAPTVLQSELKRIRARGPALPKQKKSRAKVLRNEFIQGLEATASRVGLEADMIRFTYLPPGLEASYLTDGAFEKTAMDRDMVSRVTERFLSSNCLR